jgi:hypothetical protein
MLLPYSSLTKNHSIDPTVVHVLPGILLALDQSDVAAHELVDLSAVTNTIDNHTDLQWLQTTTIVLTPG